MTDVVWNKAYLIQKWKADYLHVASIQLLIAVAVLITELSKDNSNMLNRPAFQLIISFLLDNQYNSVFMFVVEGCPTRFRRRDNFLCIT